jgi:hypothetical protein
MLLFHLVFGCSNQNLFLPFIINKYLTLILETERPPCTSCNKGESAPSHFSFVRREKEYKFLSHKLHQHALTYFSSGISSYKQPFLVYQNVDPYSHHTACVFPRTNFCNSSVFTGSFASVVPLYDIQISHF